MTDMFSTDFTYIRIFNVKILGGVENDPMVLRGPARFDSNKSELKACSVTKPASIPLYTFANVFLK